MDFSYQPKPKTDSSNKNDHQKKRPANMNSDDENFEKMFFQGPNNRINGKGQVNRASRIPRVFDAIKKKGGERNDNETESVTIESEKSGGDSDKGDYNNQEAQLAEACIFYEEKQQTAMSLESGPAEKVNGQAAPVRNVFSWKNDKNSAGKESALSKQGNQVAFIESTGMPGPSRVQTRQNVALVGNPSRISLKDYYYDILKEHMLFHDSNETTTFSKKGQKSGSAFSLYEDVKILLSIHYSDISSYTSFFSEFLNKFQFFHRTVESLRDRYKRFLKELSEKDLEKIVEFVKVNGFHGNLVFQGSKNSKTLVHIEKSNISRRIQDNQTHPSNSTSSSHTSGFTLRQLTSSLEEIENNKRGAILEIQEIEAFNEKERGKGNEQVEQGIKIEESVPNPILIRNEEPEALCPVSSEPQTEPCFCINNPIANYHKSRAQCTLLETIAFAPSENKGKAEFENLRISRNFFSGDRTIMEAESQTESIIQFFNNLALKYNKTTTQMISDLETVSGDFEDLKLLYETRNKNLQWNSIDDEAIQKATSPADLAFEILLKYKGRDSIVRRIKFKSIEVPFEF